jgi:hypothetical protein
LVNAFLEKHSNDYKIRQNTKNQNPIEKWLKKRFRDGFMKMKKSFEEIDVTKSGSVST